MRAQEHSTDALTNGALQADNWCVAQSENLGDGRPDSFQVSAPTQTTSSTGLFVDQRKVISFGDVNGVRRRVAVTINAGHAPRCSRQATRRGPRSIDMNNNASISASPRLERNDRP